MLDGAAAMAQGMHAMTHHILVVDDDPHIRALLAFAPGKAEMTVAEAADGARFVVRLAAA